MTESDESGARTDQVKFFLIAIAAIALALGTKAMLPEPSLVEFLPRWFPLVADAASTMLLVMGFGMAITELLRRGGYSV